MISVNMTTWTEKVPGNTRVPRKFDPSSDGIPPLEKKKMAKFFDDINVGHQEEPCILIDMYGRIVTWYLPGILHPARMVGQHTLFAKSCW